MTTKFNSSFWLRGAPVVGLAVFLCFVATGCKSSQAAPAPITNGSAASNGAQDPADANLAAANGKTQVLASNASYAPQQSTESYPEGQQAPAPIVRGTPENGDDSYNNPADGGAYDDGAEAAGEEAIAETDQAPPPLPEYDQPPAPEPDYLWTPGYWGWNSGYYWVPGAWVAPPYYGALWTPPYWGWYQNRYYFHRGYWGPHVGFYGGVDYGYGYIGYGYFGGYWQGNHFYYNRAVTRVNLGVIHNTYDRAVVYNSHSYDGRILNRTSYNGGNGGIRVAPRPAERAAMQERHTAPLAAQRNLRSQAASDRSQFYQQNHGRPGQSAFDHPVANSHGIAAPPQRAEQDIRSRDEQLQGGHGQVQQRGAEQHGAEQHGTAPHGAAPQQQHSPAEQPRSDVRGHAIQQREATPAQRPQQRQPQQFQQQHQQAQQQQRAQQQRQAQQQQRVQEQPRAAENQQRTNQVHEMHQDREPQPRAAQPQRAEPQRPEPRAAPQQRPEPQRAEPRAAQPERAAPQRPEPQRAAPQPHTESRPSQGHPQAEPHGHEEHPH